VVGHKKFDVSSSPAAIIDIVEARPPGGGCSIAYTRFSYYDFPMTRETIDGTPVTLEQIDEWAAEAEAGYPTERLRKRGRQPMGDGPAPVIPVRMESSMLEALMERALKEDLTRSEAIREAIRAWLSAA